MFSKAADVPLHYLTVISLPPQFVKLAFGIFFEGSLVRRLGLYTTQNRIWPICPGGKLKKPRNTRKQKETKTIYLPREKPGQISERDSFF